MTRPRSGEWPLVVFTVGLQLATGLAIVAALEAGQSSAGTARYVVSAIFPVIVLAITGSIFHVGRPFASWKALRNCGSSRLTTELVVSLLFAIAGCTESLLSWTNGFSHPALAVLTAVLGVAAVISSARIYTISTQALWNSGWTYVSFVSSALLLGGVAGSAPAFGQQLTLPVAQLLVAVGAVLFLVGTLVMVRSVVRLGRQRYAAPESVPVLELKHWLCVCGVVLLGVLFPLVSAIHTRQSSAYALATVLSAVVGVGLERTLMYSRGIALSRF